MLVKSSVMLAGFTCETRGFMLLIVPDENDTFPFHTY